MTRNWKIPTTIRKRPRPHGWGIFSFTNQNSSEAKKISPKFSTCNFLLVHLDIFIYVNFRTREYRQRLRIAGCKSAEDGVKNNNATFCKLRDERWSGDTFADKFFTRIFDQLCNNSDSVSGKNEVSCFDCSIRKRELDNILTTLHCMKDGSRWDKFEIRFDQYVCFHCTFYSISQNEHKQCSNRNVFVKS